MEKRRLVLKISIHILFLSFFMMAPFVWADETSEPVSLPSTYRMRMLVPIGGAGATVFDSIYGRVSSDVKSQHEKYTDPFVIADLERRLNQIRRSGDPRAFLTHHEWESFESNLKKLKELEQEFLKKNHVNILQAAGVNMQKLMTSFLSPPPSKSKKYNEIKKSLQKKVEDDPLYKMWGTELPPHIKDVEGVYTWGELFEYFQRDSLFRESFIEKHPEALATLSDLARRRAWDDGSVKALKVFNYGKTREFWLLDFRTFYKGPNIFEVKLSQDIDRLIEIEFDRTIRLNRVSGVRFLGDLLVYTFEHIEKGRTMEFGKSKTAQNSVFTGGKLIRLIKLDELPQLNSVGDGLSLFLGPRILQLNQIQSLMMSNTELVLAIGQFGFSITGGQAHMTLKRTDSLEGQLLKFMASLVDIITFAKSDDVDSWFELQKKLFLRTVSTGVGAGGDKALSKDQVFKSDHANIKCRRLL
jgi:hypothetical protein